jgi:hypothetical protein
LNSSLFNNEDNPISLPIRQNNTLISEWLEVAKYVRKDLIDK